MKTGFVYILRSKVNNRFYVGSTDDLKRRLLEHNTGKSTYTRLTRPFDLILSQEYETLAKARKVEYKLKRLKSRDILDRIISEGNITMEP